MNKRLKKKKFKHKILNMQAGDILFITYDSNVWEPDDAIRYCQKISELVPEDASWALMPSMDIKRLTQDELRTVIKKLNEMLNEEAE